MICERGNFVASILEAECMAPHFGIGETKSEYRTLKTQRDV